MRDKYIDYLKGILIILVVIGHSYKNTAGIFWIIYRFHMPLFFMISGYLFNNTRTIKEFTKRKFKTLIIPYIIYFIISLIVTNLFLTKIDFLTTINAFFLNGKYLIYVNNWAIWFLPFLFYISLLFYPISKIKDDKKLLLLTIILFIISVPTYKIFNKIYPNEFFPLTLQAVPPALAYKISGLLYKRNKDKIKITYNKKIVISIIFFILGIYFSLCTILSEIIRLSTYRYIATSLLLIPLILMLTKDNHNKIIEYLGRNTLVILGLHRLLIQVLMNYKFYDYLNSYNISYESTCVLISFLVIVIICLFNELNLYLKKRVYK
jgi:fucose 4-O-acetylase-like acetyltransferase